MFVFVVVGDSNFMVSGKIQKKSCLGLGVGVCVGWAARNQLCAARIVHATRAWFGSRPDDRFKGVSACARLANSSKMQNDCLGGVHFGCELGHEPGRGAQLARGRGTVAVNNAVVPKADLGLVQQHTVGNCHGPWVLVLISKCLC